MSNTQLQSFTATTDLGAYQATLGGPAWLAELREAAFAKFNSASWPTTAQEEWRRTSLRAFDFNAYAAGEPAEGAVFGEADRDAGAVPDALAPPDPDSLAGYLRFVDGRLVESSLGDDARGRSIVFAALSQIAEAEQGSGHEREAAAAARTALEASLGGADNRFEYWNLAMLRDLPVLYVPRRASSEKPFFVDFVLTGDETARSTFMVVVLEEGAAVSLVKRTSSSDEGEIMALEGEAILVGPDAQLSFASLQRLNDESLVFNNSHGSLARDGRLTRTEVELGADFVKSRFVCNLDGAGSEAHLNGVYFTTDEQHVDLRTVQDHRAPGTSSRAYYRGAVRGESHAIYQGMISVRPEARGTDAFLTNRNLILSEDARADSIPSLNISTDDVRCSHGSTTGKIDEGQIFYLQSRGYSRDEARLLIVEGYYEDIISHAPGAIQEEIRDLIKRRLDED